MNRIKKIYWITLVLVGVVASGLIFINHKEKILDVDTTNLIVALMSFCVSILSLGLATMRKPKFKGQVSAWMLKEKYNGLVKLKGKPGNCECSQIRFKIENNSSEEITGLVLTIRGDDKLIRIPMHHAYNFEEFNFGKTVIFSCSKLPVLPGLGNTNYITLEVLFVDGNWNGNRNVSIIISGNNIETKSFELYKISSVDLAKYSSANPLIVKPELAQKVKDVINEEKRK